MLFRSIQERAEEGRMRLEEGRQKMEESRLRKEEKKKRRFSSHEGEHKDRK